MAKFVFVGTHSPEDSNRASFPFIQAATAVAGTPLLKDAIAESLHGLGLPSFQDLFKQVLEAKIPIYL